MGVTLSRYAWKGVGVLQPPPTPPASARVCTERLESVDSVREECTWIVITRRLSQKKNKHNAHSKCAFTVKQLACSVNLNDQLNGANGGLRVLTAGLLFADALA